ncbi:ParA family protein [Paraclostridium bifermentans]|uniref:ParA family protein n=1 Tax=Paraclostridium bifermentans TaxID=1490 RepID=A0A5P3XB44_PARBF|nr:ParA family protein [Paraclostridium bifermentans]QEZ68478.1 ParA family protein [Paraclostridium bifermentans]
MKICSFFNVKGGVGKTTLTILTAMKLSKEGKKVLLIDADTQANLTQFLYKVVHEDKTLFQMLTENTTAKEVILKSPVEEFKNIDIIPSDISLSVLSEYLSTQMGRERAVWRWFKNNVDDIEKYDYIFVDLSPSYDLIARNFMLISDSIITPIEYQDIASIRGCELFYQKFKQDLEFLDIKSNTKRAVVINSYTTRKLSTGDLFNTYLDKFENIKADLLQARISETTVVRNAILNKMDLEDYCRKIKKAHKVRSDFNEFIEELKAKEVL